MKNRDRQQIERAIRLGIPQSEPIWYASTLAGIHNAGSARTQREVVVLLAAYPQVGAMLESVNGCLVVRHN